MSNAYPTTNGTLASTATAIVAANPAAHTDAVNNALSGLAAGYTPLNTPTLIFGVLVMCTTGYGTPTALTAPVFSYDVSTIA